MGLIVAVWTSPWCNHATDDPKKTQHLTSLAGAKERLHLFSANLLEEGSFDAIVEGCEGVFHTASPIQLSVSNPEVHFLYQTGNFLLSIKIAFYSTEFEILDMVCRISNFTTTTFFFTIFFYCRPIFHFYLLFWMIYIPLDFDLDDVKASILTTNREFLISNSMALWCVSISLLLCKMEESNIVSRVKPWRIFL